MMPVNARPFQPRAARTGECPAGGSCYTLWVPLTRSQQMARIRGRDTEPELLLRRHLWAEGIRYRIHFRSVAGRADLAFPAQKVLVFVDGCQWHGCPRHYVHPRTRQDFWDQKLRSNVDRDRRQTRTLEESGWRVLRIWEHEVFEEPIKNYRRILKALAGAAVRRTVEWRVYLVESVEETAGLERRHLIDLRDGRKRRTEIRPRMTTKWRRTPLSIDYEHS